MNLFLPLIRFDYVRFVWAIRSALAAIICLFFSYYFPNAGLWLISSAVMTLQLYAYGGRFYSKSTILVGSIAIACIGATMAVFSGALWMLWGMIVGLICLAFYFSYQGTDRGLVGIWSAVLLMINTFFPIAWNQWSERITPLLIGVIVAYVMLFVKIPRRKKDKVLTQLQNSLTTFQQYMDEVFNQLLFADQSNKDRTIHAKARDALSQLRCLSEKLGCTYNFNHTTTKIMLEKIYTTYTPIFYNLVALERTQALMLSSETKLVFEHLNTSFQSLQKSFLETSNQSKIIDSIRYLLANTKNTSNMKIAGVLYILSKLADELETLTVFFESVDIKNSVIYLQQSRL